ncbi:phage/plasmid replication domain-containing protein [Duganella radicis]|uniref:Replication-associated protein G2P N-terminal domain-containing protein n=1 Tax=Duganella radicis TaxID=551988 RepID=A0A6L6PHJ1_9BURK|nr:phage/plasmid replication protein [Duganella radicis]MTV38041.1 hypothetical protein [Duganella radicis]
MTYRDIVHIDKIRVLGPCVHKPLGKEWYLVDSETGELKPTAATPNLTTLEDGGGSIFFQSRSLDSTGMASKLLIECCPPLVLQRHNWCGHSDLDDYVFTIFDRLTRKLSLKVRADDFAAWGSGDVALLEIHLTANFSCPAGYITSVIDAIDANNGTGKHRSDEDRISLGWTPTRRSKYSMLSIYYKWKELQRRFGPRPGEVRRRLLDESRDAIRAEIKLFSQFLKRQNLNKVSAWSRIDPSMLYFEKLSSYQIHSFAQRQLTSDELRTLSKPERRVYRLWLAGTDLMDQFSSRTTVYKYAKSIKERIGVDTMARCRPKRLASLDLGEIFDRSNALGVPNWLRATRYYHSPSSS